MSFTEQFLAEVRSIIDEVDSDVIEKMAHTLAGVRSRGGRLFALGVGGNAANASHLVNDLRKIAGMEAYAPTDNVAELTARTNDEGWASVFEAWLRTSRLTPSDAVLALSVGGGSLEQNITPNLVRALSFARQTGATILGIVGRDGGYTAKIADVCVIVPMCNPAHVTPHTEAFQSIVWHLLVSHPAVKQSQTKWESIGEDDPSLLADQERERPANLAGLRAAVE
jgi:D-sedoheptulose 7-phosphate isomerase